MIKFQEKMFFNLYLAKQFIFTYSEIQFISHWDNSSLWCYQSCTKYLPGSCWFTCKMLWLICHLLSIIHYFQIYMHTISQWNSLPDNQSYVKILTHALLSQLMLTRHQILKIFCCQQDIGNQPFLIVELFSILLMGTCK